MRLNPKHQLRKLGKHYMIVDGCTGNADLANVYTLNETAAFLWQRLAGKDFGTDDLVDILCEEYDVDPATARADSERLLEHWKSFGFILD